MRDHRHIHLPAPDLECQAWDAKPGMTGDPEPRIPGTALSGPPDKDTRQIVATAIGQIENQPDLGASRPV